MKYLFIFLFPFTTFANFDFYYGGNSRSYPGLGGEFTTKTGYSFLLRGEPKSLTHSLLRFELEANTSIVVHKLEPTLLFYPLSFLAIGTGKTTMISNYEEFDYLDCTQFRCSGLMEKEFKLAKLAFGLGPIISTFEYRVSDNLYGDEDNLLRPVLEYESALLVNPREEKEVNKRAFLGINIAQNLMIGALSTRAEYLKVDKFFQMNIGIISLTKENMNFIFGAGNLNNSDLRNSDLIVLQFKHQLIPSMALF